MKKFVFSLFAIVILMSSCQKESYNKTLITETSNVNEETLNMIKSDHTMLIFSDENHMRKSAYILSNFPKEERIKWETRWGVITSMLSY